MLADADSMQKSKASGLTAQVRTGQQTDLPQILVVFLSCIAVILPIVNELFAKCVFKKQQAAVGSVFEQKIGGFHADTQPKSILTTWINGWTGVRIGALSKYRRFFEYQYESPLKVKQIWLSRQSQPSLSLGF